MSLKDTSSDLNRVSKEDIIKGEEDPKMYRNPGSGVTKEVGTRKVWGTDAEDTKKNS